MGSFFHYNYPSRKEEEWTKLKNRFFDYLRQCQEEWRTIKEEKPLQYMPYVETRFQALTGVRLKGLSQFTAWIKPGSYYHGVVAKRGQIYKCLHLAGTQPPKGPQVCPSQIHQDNQERRRLPRAIPLHQAKRLARLKGHAPMHPLPWRQVEWEMASPGQNRLRQAPRKNGGGADPQNATGPCPVNERVILPIPSHIKIAREGMRQSSSSTDMQVSSHQPTMMWLLREWPTTTLIWGWVW